MCNLGARTLVTMRKESVFSVVSKQIQLYFYIVSFYTCIYLLNVHREMRSMHTLLLFMYCKIYIECKPIKNMKLETVYDQSSLLVLLRC